VIWVQPIAPVTERPTSVVRHSVLYLSSDACERSLGSRDLGEDVRSGGRSR
jgi:hypothetical protein